MPSWTGYEDNLIEGQQTFDTIQDSIDSVVLDQSKFDPRKPVGAWWTKFFLLGFLGANILLLAIGWLLYQGIGIWGNNQPSGWGFDIINFVWWIGIGHAGTLISAILLLMRQKWRMSINRFAEAMTIFAVMCAGMYPLLHTGRPWVAYWLFPYPNWLSMWPNFRSPLVWDVFAVSTYFTISLLFWLLGLIPDFASLRDKASNKIAKYILSIAAMGWNGSVKHWTRYEQAYVILAGLSTPLVLSVHSIVSFDFAVSLVPGWHTTIFPPYFVAGAVFAGFAMVLTFGIPVRRWYKLEHLITMKHIDWMCKIMLATGIIVFYGYMCELFFAFYSGSKDEINLVMSRLHGPYAWSYYLLLICNGVLPQILWSQKLRQNLKVVFAISQVVSIGMWLERFVIIPVSLTRDFVPSSWAMYVPTVWDFGMYLGTIGFFFVAMFLFLRFLPMIAIAEMKDLLHRTNHDKHVTAHAVPVGGKE